MLLYKVDELSLQNVRLSFMKELRKSNGDYKKKNLRVKTKDVLRVGKHKDSDIRIKHSKLSG